MPLFADGRRRRGGRLGRPSSDQDFHKDFLSDPIPQAGTYFIEISASPYFDAGQSAYDAIVRLE